MYNQSISFFWAQYFSIISSKRIFTSQDSAMSSSQEILRQAFPDKATPQVSSGITYIESCLKHLNETFKATKVYLIASGSLTRNTTFTSELPKALGPKLAKTRVGMTPHTMMSEVLEVVEDARNVEADCIITLGGGSLSDAAKLISFVSHL
jgi:alcohol dehydrogenase class IV